MRNIYGVIMAGGGGTRFWPLSRKSNPKQLLNLSGKDVMVNETVSRLLRVCEKENIFIVTNKVQADKMRETVKKAVRPQNVLPEPCARNTSACIGYAAVKILKENGDGVMVVTPSDAYIKNEEEYARILKVAVNTAEQTDSVVTLGITPTFPATGYGYIHFDETDDGEVKNVIKFVEKPDIVRAEEYYKSGKYAWNSGVFVFRASVILKRIEECLPEVYKLLQEIYESVGTTDEQIILEKVYPEIPSISIDYGVMEKTTGIKVVAGEFGWNDVGSWDMMDVLHERDENGNVRVGDTTLIDTVNSTVYSSGKKVAVLGMDGVVVVETPDAVLVCPKEKAQEIKKIVDKLKEEGKDDLL